MTELDFHHLEYGDRDALPVVFLHAFPYHGGMWDGQRAILADRVRFISFDVRGLGRSSLSRSAFMLEHLVDDLFALLDRLSIESAMLCGLSMGGYIALRAAQREPGRIRGLVLADTQSASDGNDAKLARAEGVRSVRRDGIDAFADGQLKRGLSPNTHANRPEIVARLRAMILESSPAGIEDALVALATRTDTTEDLAKITAPTCVLVGEHDVITPPSAARALAAGIPNARLHVLENAGHISNVEAALEWNRLLIEHVGRVS
jgi:3-oxoadipate enol-lactonase